jgi:curli biogenesis system outer membrane secretion channel CsgG/outer membrane protein OmpA-like peptidoglycan-associated protein
MKPILTPPLFKACGGLLLLVGVVGCSSTGPIATATVHSKEAPVMAGSTSRNNATPLEPAFVCLSQAFAVAQVPLVAITVGDMKDYTGKYSQTEGNAITQGGSLMMYSALGKMGRSVRLQERFDTRIAELELAYADRRQLGDGQLHAVEAGKPQVPWVPYFGGSILRSDYYIVGGITEVNYNIQSRGAEFNVSSIGGKVRTFTMNVGVDMRIVDSRSLLVVKTISMQKQITGTEVGAGIFRFFGTDLLDVNMGSKNQEPLQLGVRTTIEHGLLELLGAVSGLPSQPCVDYALTGPQTAENLQSAIGASTQAVLKAREQALQAAPITLAPVPSPPTAMPAQPASVPPAVNVVQANNAPVAKPEDLTPVVNGAVASAMAGGVLAIVFEPQKPDMDGSSMQSLRAAGQKLAADKTQKLKIEVLTRETENLPGEQRRQLAQERTQAISRVLQAAGVPANRISVKWLLESGAATQRQGAGMQLVAKMKISALKSSSGG